MAAVLQWAYNNGKFSLTFVDHNGIDQTTAKHGSRKLIEFNDTYKVKINFTDGVFTVHEGFENHPVVGVSWYGAIMFCNWLTEMRDNNTNNVVYTGMAELWIHTDTVENSDRSGYRLPSIEEWEFAARYIGTTQPTQGNLAIEYIAKNINGGLDALTEGYFWTPAFYASGALKHAYYSDADTITYEAETRAVAWYSGDEGMDGTNRVMPVGLKTANYLGLYDMSGNLNEWCFTLIDGNRTFRSSNYTSTSDRLRLGYWNKLGPGGMNSFLGFRFVRTQ